MSKNILVLATHPDDETLGCGGTLLKHKELGDTLYWCIVTTYDPQQTEPELFNRREQEIARVAEAYGFEKVFRLPFVTTQLDTTMTGALIAHLSAIFKEVQPHTLYLPYLHDVHSDHRVTFEAAYSCTKSFRYPFIKRIMMMETLSETEFAPALHTFSPNVFVDISNHLERKIEIMRIFENELGTHPFPRSETALRSLATLRGAASGTVYAESFMLLKEIL